MARLTWCVVIPMYNRAGLIRATLDSLLSQDRRPDRLVVVDDGSTDGGLSQVERWQRERHPAIPVLTVRQENQGCSAARNRGAELVRDCDLLMFLDSDDTLPAELPAQACAALANDRQCVAAFRNSQFVWEDTGERERNDTAGFAVDPIGHMITVRVPPVPSATVIRARCHFQIGGFDARLPCHEDTDYMLRLSLTGPLTWLPGEPVPIRRLCSKCDFKKGSVNHHNSATVHSTAGHLALAAVWTRHLRRSMGAAGVTDAQNAFLRKCWKTAATSLLREGRRRESAWCFDRALELDPRNPWMVWRRFKSLPLGRPRRPAACVAL